MKMGNFVVKHQVDTRGNNRLVSQLATEQLFQNIQLCREPRIGLEPPIHILLYYLW